MTTAWSTQLCPWLVALYERLDTARREGHMGHAWLLAGPRGIGKSNFAHVFATALATGGGTVPAPLKASVAFDARPVAGEDNAGHPDVHVLGPGADKRSIGVDQVRAAIEQLSLTSHGGSAKGLIIEPAEAMTVSAANALLKTLEEPTRETYFFLVSHQPGYLPATIRSRSQLLTFRIPPSSQALAWLNEGLESEQREAAHGMLALSGGAPIRALDLLRSENSKINNELESFFCKLAEKEVDAHSVVDSWLKRDPEPLLEWLATRLEWAIKARLAPEAWTPVTDLGADTLHNAWRKLTLAALFERWSETRVLLGQLGRGVKVDLGLRVLIQEFAFGVVNGE